VLRKLSQGANNTFSHVGHKLRVRLQSSVQYSAAYGRSTLHVFRSIRHKLEWFAFTHATAAAATTTTTTTTTTTNTVFTNGTLIRDRASDRLTRADRNVTGGQDTATSTASARSFGGRDLRYAFAEEGHHTISTTPGRGAAFGPRLRGNAMHAHNFTSP
jgi:hypothetical protein